MRWKTGGEEEARGENKRTGVVWKGREGKSRESVKVKGEIHTKQMEKDTKERGKYLQRKAEGK